MMTKRKFEKHRRLKKHVRLRISGSPDRPRLAVYRSLRHVYAQLVDDVSGKTLVAISDLTKGVREEFKDLKGQVAVGRKVGLMAAKLAMEKNIKQVVFDRGGYNYHGAVKAVADGAREGGLQF